MKILTIEYRETKSFGTYANVSVGAVVQVNPEHGHEDEYGRLVDWVRNKIDLRIAEARQRDEDRREVYRKTDELQTLERKIADAKDHWERAEAFLAKHGVVRNFDEMPF